MEKVHFTEEKATMLATLYGRALDNRSPDPLLGDQAADDAVRRIDYDFGKLGVDKNLAAAVALRAKPMDAWAGQFVREHPTATVLHLGCGMDSRVYRLDPPPTVSWFDVDYPEVIALRTKIYPSRPGYQQIGTSVTDFAWLDQVPSDRPTLVIAEGLTMYLQVSAGEELLRRIVARFPSGEIILDLYSRLGIKLQKLNPVVRKANATLYWGVDDPAELERLGLTLASSLDVATAYPDSELERVAPSVRFQIRLAKMIPAFRRMGHIVRYRF